MKKVIRWAIQFPEDDLEKNAAVILTYTHKDKSDFTKDIKKGRGKLVKVTLEVQK